MMSINLPFSLKIHNQEYLSHFGLAKNETLRPAVEDNYVLSRPLPQHTRWWNKRTSQGSNTATPNACFLILIVRFVPFRSEPSFSTYYHRRSTPIKLTSRTRTQPVLSPPAGHSPGRPAAAPSAEGAPAAFTGGSGTRAKRVTYSAGSRFCSGPFYGTVLAFAFPTRKQSRETNRILTFPSLLLLDEPKEKRRALVEASAEPVWLIKPHGSS